MIVSLAIYIYRYKDCYKSLEDYHDFVITDNDNNSFCII